MARRIDYSPVALDELKAISLYLHHRFGAGVAAKQLDRIEKQLSLLAEQPCLGPAVNPDAPNQRYHVLHPRLIVYYQVEADSLYLYHLHDTRLPPPEEV